MHDILDRLVSEKVDLVNSYSFEDVAPWCLFNISGYKTVLIFKDSDSRSKATCLTLDGDSPYEKRPLLSFTLDNHTYDAAIRKDFKFVGCMDFKGYAMAIKNDSDIAAAIDLSGLSDIKYISLKDSDVYLNLSDVLHYIELRRSEVRNKNIQTSKVDVIDHEDVICLNSLIVTLHNGFKRLYNNRSVSTDHEIGELWAEYLKLEKPIVMGIPSIVQTRISHLNELIFFNVAVSDILKNIWITRVFTFKRDTMIDDNEKAPTRLNMACVVSKEPKNNNLYKIRVIGIDDILLRNITIGNITYMAEKAIVNYVKKNNIDVSTLPTVPLHNGEFDGVTITGEEVITVSVTL